MQDNICPNEIEQRVFDYLSLMSFPYADIVIEQITTAEREISTTPCYVDLKYTITNSPRKVPELPNVTPLNVYYYHGSRLKVTLVLFVRSGLVESIEIDSWLVDETEPNVYENSPIDWECFWNAEPQIYIDLWSDLNNA